METITLSLRQTTELTPMELLRECRDAATRDVVKRITLCANARSVLITGENGTGKELVAHALVESGERSTKPIVRVDCTQLQSDLIRSELFGHKRGSFTGAHEDRIGMFQQAHGGTAFLDEIGEIPLDLQPKLLSVLESRTFQRVGDSQTIHSDFKFIAATNRDLRAMVHRHQFREDLYYRIEAFRIPVSPLRERMEDVIRLANMFVDQFSAGTKMLDAAAEDLIKAHSWPGNVRELKSAIERAVLFAEKEKLITKELLYIDPHDMCGQQQSSEFRLEQVTNTYGHISVKHPADILELMRIMVTRIEECMPHLIRDGKLLTYVERLLVDYILQKTGGSKLAAANLLGIGRQTLYNKIKTDVNATENAHEQQRAE